MIRKVYCVECFDIEEGELVSRTYYRNRKAADRICKRNEKRGYEVIVRDCTWAYKHGEPIREEWIEG